MRPEALADETSEYEIDRPRATKVFRVRYLTGLTAFSLFFWLPIIAMHFNPNAPAGIHYWIFPFHFVFGLAFLIAVVLPAKQVAAFRYWLSGTTLRIDEGVVFLKRKSIPLDRITDIVMVQGPIMRMCGVWSLQIQTAGSHQQGPEGALHGVVDPESVRDKLMAARDRIVGANRNKTED